MPHTLLFSSDLFLSFFFFVFFLTLCSFQFSPGSIWEKVLVAGHSIGFVALKWVMTHSLKNTEQVFASGLDKQRSAWLSQHIFPVTVFICASVSQFPARPPWSLGHILNDLQPPHLDSESHREPTPEHNP